MANTITVPLPVAGTPNRHRRAGEQAPASRGVKVGSPTGAAAAAAAVAAESERARGVGWAGLFDGPPPPRAGGGGSSSSSPSVAGSHRRETPRLRWLARALRDSVAERVWAAPCDGGSGGGSGAVEAMKLLLEDLAHAYQGRRASARRALQSVLVSSPAGRRTAAAAGGRGRVAWTPTGQERAGAGRGGEGDEGGEERVVVSQREADEEQCGWLFWCRELPAWADVSVSWAAQTRGGGGRFGGRGVHGVCLR